MKTIVVTIIVVASLMVNLGCDGERPPTAEAAKSLDYGIERAEWTLTPAAASEIAKMAAADVYRPHEEPTRVFVRTQLKYGLERDDFLHKWYDRPLMQDSSFQAAEEKGHAINRESWLRQAALGRLCGHGFSAFTITSGRDDIIPRSVMPGGEVPVMVELVGTVEFVGGDKPNVTAAMQRIDEAVRMPNAFRIGGRTVITSYPVIRLDSKPMIFYRELKRETEKRYGDKVAFLPYFSPFEVEARRPLDLDDIAKAKETLRTVLREMDGICFPALSTMDWNRRLNPRFSVDVVAPLLHGVYSEPEFKDKLLGMVVLQGHENCYRWNYAKDCTGTRAFRDCLEAVRAIRPDFVNACEWDEQNENTHHRPTVAMGFVTQRLLRYATSMLEGKAPPVYPDDDTSIPNLVLSYRKSLLPGEPIEVEVLNIPDGTFKGSRFTVQLRLRNAAGAVVKEYPPQWLPADELKAAWFVSPAIELLAEPILKPELTVWHDGRRSVFADGFWPISLHANRNIEFRWVKQALRERAVGTTGTLTVSAPAADGTVEVSGEVASAEDLRSVEVLDGPDTVYLFDPKEPYRDADGALLVKVALQGLGLNRTERPSGTIRLVGAPTAAFRSLDPERPPKFANIHRITASDHEVRFDKSPITAWERSVFANIPAAEVETAVFEVEMPPYFTGRVKAKDLIRDDIFSLPAAGGMNLVFRRWLSARNLTPPCGGRTAKFSFRMKPTSPDSVLRLQTIDAKYHISRCAVHSFFKPSDREVTVKAFDRDAETVSSVRIDANRAYGLDYRFSPARGGVVESGAGLGLDGILCGYMPLVCGYGSGESGNGNLMCEHKMNAKFAGWPDTVPKYVKEPDGFWSLAFTNCNFVTLPQQVVPIYSGFTLEIEINPNEVARKQGVFATGHAYFNVFIQEGRACAELMHRNHYMYPKGQSTTFVWGPEVKPGCWQKITVTYDREQCRVDVGETKGEPVAVSGDFFYARHAALGTLGEDGTFFNGRIRRLKSSPFNE